MGRVAWKRSSPSAPFDASATISQPVSGQGIFLPGIRIQGQSHIEIGAQSIASVGMPVKQRHIVGMAVFVLEEHVQLQHGGQVSAESLYPGYVFHKLYRMGDS